MKTLTAVLSILLLVLVAGCPGKGGSPATTPDPAGATDAAPAPTGGGEADPACVAECVSQNQQRAVGAEVIEADCERECLEGAGGGGGEEPPADEPTGSEE